MEIAIIGCIVSVVGLTITVLTKTVSISTSFAKLQSEVEQMQRYIHDIDEQQKKDAKENAKNISRHETLITVQQSKLDDIGKNVESINAKIDRLLARN